MRKTWHIRGMFCPQCEKKVRKALEGRPGLEHLTVSSKTGMLQAEWDPHMISEAQIRELLAEQGYGFETGRPGAAGLLGFLLAAVLLYVLLTRSPLADLSRAFPVARAGMSLAALFLVGLMTSAHCVSMCGGICLSQSSGAAGTDALGRSLAYNAGRVLSYGLTGALLGALGSVVQLNDQIRAILQILLAVLMILMAARMAGVLSFDALHLPRLGITEKLRYHGTSAFLIGLLNGLMPCGPLQAMQIAAMAAGGALMGALCMMAFALGTVPLMLLFGIAGGRIQQRFGKPMQLGMAALVLAMGISTLAGGLALTGQVQPVQAHTDGRVLAVVEDGKQIVHTQLDYGQYTPIVVAAHVPVEWHFEAEAGKLNACNGEIVIPAYEIHRELMPGDNVICFTPGEPGKIGYSCWMGMIHSSITVVESL